MTAMPTLAIVIVSWNVCELLRRCLESIALSLAGSAITYRVIVVDNASTDGTPAMLLSNFPSVQLFETGANLGFAGGNNVALRTILQDVQTLPDYLLLLNPDTEVVGDALARLVCELHARPELVALGPQLRYADGSPQPSRRRFPTRLGMFWEGTSLERLWPQNPWAQQYRCADQPADRFQEVGWLVGAAVLVRATAILHAGLLDERFFMYSEELEWQWRLQQADGAARPGSFSVIAFLPTAIVTHYEGKSSEQAPAHRYINFQQSKLLLARMRFGWCFAASLEAFLRVGYGCEIVVESVKLLLGHRPALRRQRIGVYWQLLCALRREW